MKKKIYILTFLILILISVLMVILNWSKFSIFDLKSDTELNTQAVSSPTILDEKAHPPDSVQENVSIDTPPSINNSNIKSKVKQESKRKTLLKKPLLEIVDEDPTVNDKDTSDKLIEPIRKTITESQMLKTTSLSLKDHLKGASLISGGFSEEETSAINGIWFGKLKTSKIEKFTITLNRIWDHLTGDYLPTSCFSVAIRGQQQVGYLRNKNLKFYEKKIKSNSILIIVLKKNFLFEFDAPRADKNYTYGRGYFINGDTLQSIGTYVVERENAATADTNCENNEE